MDNGRGAMMKRERNILYVPYAFLVLVIILMFHNLFTMMFKSKIKLFEIRSPLIFCFIVAFGLLVFLVLSIMDDIKNADNTENKSTFIEDEDLKRIILYVIGLIVYVRLLPIFHFMTTTMIFMIIVTFLLNDSKKVTHKLLQSIISSVILVPVVYYVFYEIFDVMLP
jgi:hypothetical protein